ncbi:MAG: hypothetical protein ACYTG2_08970 [Planctomycetota bacterium]|jgi:uncharacterized integral membrane protein
MPGTTRPRRIALLLAAIVCLGAILRLVSVSADQLASPYDLMYESPNLATVRVIQAGESPYDEAVYDGVPFTLTPYTPAYFYLLAALPETDGSPFLTARIVSLAAILLCAIVLVSFARGAAIALTGAGVFLLAWPVTAYAAYLRMDPLAVACSALCLLALRRPTPRRVDGAALLAVLAVATKQTYVAAAVAGTLFLLFRDRRLALRFVLVGSGLGVALAALATLVWGEGFWFSILVLRDSPVSLSTLWEQARIQLRSPVFDLLLLTAVLTAGLAWRRHGASVLGRSPSLAYLVCASLVLLLTLGKEGSSAVYFVELALALPLWLAEAFERDLTAPRGRLVCGLLLLACVGAELATGGTHRDLYAFPPNSVEDDGAYYASVRAGFERAGHADPRVLNLGPPRHAYAVADDVCMNDVSTYDQAYEQGVLDPTPLVAAIRDQAYDVVVVTRFATPERTAGRPMEGAIAAVRDTYRLLWADDVASYYGR